MPTMKVAVMKFKIIGFGLALFLVGCDTDDLSLSVSPAIAQSQPGPQVGNFEGRWSGQIDLGNSVALDIIQEGTELRGDGIVFENDNPFPVQVQGDVSNDSFQLNLYPEDPEATEDFLLQGRLTGNTAECYLGTNDEYDDRSLTMERIGAGAGEVEIDAVQGRLDDDTSTGLPQRLIVDMSNPDTRLQVTLTLEKIYIYGTVIFRGTWRSNQPLGPTHLGDAQVREGLVSGGGIPGKPDWCEFNLYAHPTREFQDVAKFIFRRPQGIGSRFITPLDLNSWALLTESGRPSGSQALAKRQFFGGSVSPVISNP